MKFILKMEVIKAMGYCFKSLLLNRLNLLLMINFPNIGKNIINKNQKK